MNILVKNIIVLSVLLTTFHPTMSQINKLLLKFAKESDSPDFTLSNLEDVPSNDIKLDLLTSLQASKKKCEHPQVTKPEDMTDTLTDKNKKLCTKALQTNFRDENASSNSLTFEEPADLIENKNIKISQDVLNQTLREEKLDDDAKDVEVNFEDQTNPTSPRSEENLSRDNNPQQLDEQNINLDESITYALLQQQLFQLESNMLSKEEEVKKNEKALLKICQDWEAEYAVEQKLKRREKQKRLEEQRKLKEFQEQQKQLKLQHERHPQRQQNRYRFLHLCDGQRPCDSRHSVKQGEQNSSKYKKKRKKKKKKKKKRKKKKGSLSSESSLSSSSSSSDSDNNSNIKALFELQPSHSKPKLATPDNELFFIPRIGDYINNDNMEANQHNRFPKKMLLSLPNLSDSDSDSDSEELEHNQRQNVAYDSIHQQQKMIRKEDCETSSIPSSNSPNHSWDHEKIKLSFRRTTPCSKQTYV